MRDAFLWGFGFGFGVLAVVCVAAFLKGFILSFSTAFKASWERAGQDKARKCEERRATQERGH